MVGDFETVVFRECQHPSVGKTVIFDFLGECRLNKSHAKISGDTISYGFDIP